MHIDWWTLALQAVNVLILVWLLQRLLYRPVAGIIEARRAAAAKLIEDASRARGAVDAEKAAIAEARAGFAREHDAILAEARTRAQAEHDALLKSASEDIARQHTQGGIVLARERTQMERSLIGHAGTLAVDIAGKLLRMLPAEIATQGFVAQLSAQIRALPPKDREQLAAAAGKGELYLVAAVPLDDAQQALCRQAVVSALGTETEISFRCDGGLIAGLELGCDALVLRNSWRSALARIAEQLHADG